jgi:hypothetical protein
MLSVAARARLLSTVAAGLILLLASTAAAQVPGKKYSIAQWRQMGTWCDEDHLEKVRDGVYLLSPARQALLVLVGVDPFLSGAAVAVFTKCNRHEAKLNLRVARAILSESRRTPNGHYDADWSPPDITDEKSDEDKCAGE